MTREQREAKYKEARERIFKGFEESDNVDTNSVAEESKEVSRSSSTNGRKMPRKQRSAQDDGFEARSQFNAYYPPMRYMNQGFVATGPDTSFYGPYALPLANIGGQAAGLSGQQLPQHGSTYQQTSAYMPQFQAGLQQPFVAGPAISYGQAFADQSTLGYDPMLHSQYNQVPQQTTMASQRSSAMSSPAMSNFAQPVPPQAQTSNQQWTPSYYQSSYQAQALQHPSPAGQRQQYQTTTNMPPLVPYAYGALPSQPFQSGRSTYQNQHPLPGSFNRQSFNPKTQAFVPGSGFVTNQIGGYGPRPYPINANSQGPSHAHMYQASSSMQRQGPQVHGSTSFSMPQPSHGNGSMVSSIPTITAQPPQGRPSGQSSLSKWGTPSHLPPKPPPPQMPNFKTNQPSLPQNVYAAAGSQPYSQHTRSMQHGLPVNNGGTVLPVPGTSIKMT